MVLCAPRRLAKIDTITFISSESVSAKNKSVFSMPSSNNNSYVIITNNSAVNKFFIFFLFLISLEKTQKAQKINSNSGQKHISSLVV